MGKLLDYRGRNQVSVWIRIHQHLC